MDGRRGGFTAAAVVEVPATEEERLAELGVPAVVVDPPVVVEPPRERMRFLRRDYAAPQAPPREAAREPMSERLLETLSAALTALAAKPAQPVALHVAPSTVELVMPNQPLANIEVTVPERSIEVNVPERHVDVHVPEQAAPTVHVENIVPQPEVLVAAPEVTVQAPPPAHIEVIVPDQPAPIVNVENHVDVEVPRPRPVRVEKLAGGAVRYVPEDV